MPEKEHHLVTEQLKYKDKQAVSDQPGQIRAENLSLFYGSFQALQSVNIEIPAYQVTALIGPSGCGKSTFLKTLNRMNDLIDGVRVDGHVYIDDVDIYGDAVDVPLLRKKIGMVFQKPNPFPMSIYDNIAYGPRIHGIKRRLVLDEIVEQIGRASCRERV